MTEFSKDRRIDQLKTALYGLSQSADIQLKLYPDTVCKADELALDYDCIYMAIIKDTSLPLGNSFRGTLLEIDQILNEMSNNKEANYWSDEALSIMPEWESIRILARRALAYPILL